MELAASARKVRDSVESLCQQTERRAHDFLRHSTYELTSPKAGGESVNQIPPILRALPSTLNSLTQLAQSNHIQILDLSGTGPISLENNAILCNFVKGPQLRILKIRGIYDIKGCLEYSGKAFESVVSEFDDKIQEKEEVLTEVMNEVSREVGVPPNGDFTVTNYNATLQYLAKLRLDRVANFIRALGENQTIEELDFSGNALGTVANAALYCTQLSRVLDENATLTRLDLTDNNLAMANIGILSKGLTKNVKLLWVNLSGNGLLREGGDLPAGEEGTDEAVFGPLQLGLEALGEVLRKNKFMKEIVLRNNDILAEGVTAPLGEGAGVDTPFYKFIDPLKKYHRITTLDLASNALGDGGVALLCDTLRQNKSVTSLNVSDNEVAFEGLRALASLFSVNVLQRLYLRRNPKLGVIDTLSPLTTSAPKKVGKKRLATSQECVKAFCIALLSNTSVIELDMSGCKLGAQTSSEISQAICGRENVVMDLVDLGGCNIGSGGVELVVPTVQPLLAKSKSLELQWNFFDLNELEKLFTTPDSSPKPICESLNLSRCGLNIDLSRGATSSSAKFVFPFHTLVSLDLSYNTEVALFNTFVESLSAVSSSASLRKVNLSFTQLPEDILMEILNTKWFTTSCVSLDVSGNVFTDGSVETIASALVQGRALRSFLCGGTSISTEGILKVFQTQTSPTLHQLILWGSHTPKADYDNILENALKFVEKNTSLTLLDVNALPIGMSEKAKGLISKLQEKVMLNAAKQQN
eukprot:PhF_6_TR8334/c0_g1_i2/m.13017